MKTTYYPKSDTMLYVAPISTDDMSHMLAQLTTLFNEQLEKNISDYAILVHDKDIVTESDIEEQLSRRRNYIARSYYEITKQLITKKLFCEFQADDPHLDQNALSQAISQADSLFPTLKSTEAKPVHLYILLHFKKSQPINVVASWFEGIIPSIPEYFRCMTDGVEKYETAKVFKQFVKKSSIVNPDRFDKAMLILMNKFPFANTQYDTEIVQASFDCKEKLEIAETHAKHKMTQEDIIAEVNTVLLLIVVAWLTCMN